MNIDFRDIIDKLYQKTFILDSNIDEISDFSKISKNEFPENTLILTKREKEISKLLLENPDLSYSEIGEKLFISEKTVSKHLSNCFKKSKTKNKLNYVSSLKSTLFN